MELSDTWNSAHSSQVSKHIIRIFRSGEYDFSLLYYNSRLTDMYVFISSKTGSQNK